MTRGRRSGVGAALILAAGLTAAGPAAQQAIYQKATQTVAVYATVLDRDGHLVGNLTRRDFQIFDNGRPADITVFSNDQQSLMVTLMLDTSYSMQSRLSLVKESTRRFIDALQPGDRLRLGTFAEEIAVSPLLTGNKADLLRVLDEEVWPGGTTPLWAALDEAMASFAGETNRRVVMALTDGISTAGHVDPEVVRSHAINDSVMIYVVGMEGTTLGTTVVQLADDTGGGHFEVPHGATLAATFARVADELRHQYALGFTPVALDGHLHTIDVRLGTPGLSARARRSYMATADR